jgi:hypothetical protein
MVLFALNYVAIACFLVFMALLAFVLVKYLRLKLHANSRAQILHIKTAVIFATSTGAHLRKLKINHGTRGGLIKLRHTRPSNAANAYCITVCDVSVQNYNIF